MNAFDVLDDRFVEFVAADADRVRNDHIAEGDDAHFGRTAADIAHHVTGRFENGNLRADRSRSRFGYRFDLFRSGTESRFDDGPAFDIGDARGNSDPHAHRAEKLMTGRNLRDKIFDHLFGTVDIGDNAVGKGSDRDDTARRFIEHTLRFGTDGSDSLCPFFDGYDGRFVYNDTLAAYIDQRIASTEIDSDIDRKIIKQTHFIMPPETI